MMRALILIHRWLGIAFCLLVRDVVRERHRDAFRAVSRADRSRARRRAGAARSCRAAGTARPMRSRRARSSTPTRVRLVARSDGPVYRVGRDRAWQHFMPPTCRALACTSEQPGARHCDRSRPAARARRDRGQCSPSWHTTISGPFPTAWTRTGRCIASRSTTAPGPNSTCHRRPAKSCATRRAPSGWWNYAGSVPHWIYPTALRQQLGGVGSHGVVAVARCDGRRDVRRACSAYVRLRFTPAPPRVAFSRLARVASLARACLHRFSC